MKERWEENSPKLTATGLDQRDQYVPHGEKRRVDQPRSPVKAYTQRNRRHKAVKEHHIAAQIEHTQGIHRVDDGKSERSRVRKDTETEHQYRCHIDDRHRSSNDQDQPGIDMAIDGKTDPGHEEHTRERYPTPIGGSNIDPADRALSHCVPPSATLRSRAERQTSVALRLHHRRRSWACILTSSAPFEAHRPGTRRKQLNRGDDSRGRLYHSPEEMKNEFPRSNQAHHASLGMPKAALPVERFQVGRIVHVKPFDAVVPLCHIGRTLYQLTANATAAQIRVHRRIQDERVDATIPRHVDKAHQAVALVSTDVRQAMTEHWAPVRCLVIRPRRGKERIERLVGYGCADTVNDHR